MRNSSAIDALFPKTRQGILAATVMHPDRWWYLSDLAKHLGRRPSSLQRELAAMADAGILRTRRDGNRVYFQADPSCPFLRELQGIMTKTAGLIDVLRELLEPLSERIDWAFVYGSIARAQELPSSDVDLMIVGRVGLADVAPALRDAERRLSRPVNPSVYTRQEFAKKLETGHHFLKTVLDGEKLFVLGKADGLAATLDGQPRSGAHDERQELDDLRAVIDRDLKDAALPGLSPDRKFATAYNAALQSAKMAVACAGYRVVGGGHHQTAFQAVELTLGPGSTALVTYFDTCRRKRNRLDYDAADLISETEADEISAKAEELKRCVEAWISQYYPQFEA